MNHSLTFGFAPSFNVMAKPVGSRCNLDCTYCYYLSKKEYYPDSTMQMSDSVLKQYVKQYIESAQIRVVEFLWQGGEPTLLKLEFFQKVIELQKEFCPQTKEVKNIFQTNGTLLTDEWCSFFKEHNFLIGISCDGPEEIHDLYRRDINGEASHHSVVESIELLQKHKVDYNILCTVHKGNFNKGKEVYRYFRDVLKSNYLQFIPIVKMKIEDQHTIYEKEEVSEAPEPTAESLTGKEYGQFLTSIFDEWVTKDVGNVFVQLFDNTLAKWYGEPSSICIMQKSCGDALVMEHNGDLYSCDHYVYSRNKLGNIMDTHMRDLVTSAKQSNFRNKKFVMLPTQCKKCKYLEFCYGGCPKNRLSYTKDGEWGLNNLCEGYQMFHSHTAKAMQYMAEMLQVQRSPAEVMNWIRKQ